MRLKRENRLRVGPRCPLPVGVEANRRPLFSYQIQAVDALLEWHRNERNRGLLVLPTGAGKTRVAAELVMRAVLQGPNRGRCLWLTHRTELADQAVSTLASLAHQAERSFVIGQHLGRTTRSRDDVDVVVASIPSLVERKTGLFNRFDQLWQASGGFTLLIVDEAHHAAAETWCSLLEHAGSNAVPPRILGLTATPTRQTPRERVVLHDLMKTIVFEVQPITLIQSGHLARPSVTLVATSATYSTSKAEIASARGDLPQALLNRIAADETRNELAVSTYVERRHEWGRTVFFAGRIEQCNYLTSRLRLRGVRAASVDGSCSAKDRNKLLGEFRRGELDVLCNVMVFTEGTDIPGTKSVFLVRPTRSPVLFQQMVGRAMRGPAVGGLEQCNVVAFVDHLNGLAEQQVAHNYAWEWEQSQKLGFIGGVDPTWLGSPVSLRPTRPTRDATDEAATREKLRQGLATGNVDYSTLRSSLRGWWQQETSFVGKIRPLPYFDGDAALKPWVDALSDLVRRESLEQTIPETRTDLFLTRFPVPSKLPIIAAATARAFAYYALSRARPRAITWVSSEAASESQLRQLVEGMGDWPLDPAYNRSVEDLLRRALLSVAKRLGTGERKRLLSDSLLKDLAKVRTMWRTQTPGHGDDALLDQLGDIAHERRMKALRSRRWSYDEMKMELERLEALDPAHPNFARLPAQEVVDPSLRSDHQTVLFPSHGGVVFGRVIRLSRVGDGGVDMVVGRVGGATAIGVRALGRIAGTACVGHFLVAGVEQRTTEGADFPSVVRGSLSLWEPSRDESDENRCPKCSTDWLFRADAGSVRVCAMCHD